MMKSTSKYERGIGKDEFLDDRPVIIGTSRCSFEITRSTVEPSSPPPPVLEISVTKKKERKVPTSSLSG